MEGRSAGDGEFGNWELDQEGSVYFLQNSKNFTRFFVTSDACMEY
jgi:hypothetical protein